MQKYGINLLRISLGIVFLWFGVLKVIGQSPVEYLIAQTYSFLPAKEFIYFLGVWEIIIGLGLLFKVSLRPTLMLLLLQMAGTFVAPLLNPALFFKDSNLLLLTTEGEFVVKNLVLVAGALVIGGSSNDKKII